jgi:CRP-like cAMP-binding protein
MSGRKDGKDLKDLERAVAQAPGNLARRLELAALLRGAGRREESVALVRSVAVAYQTEGRLVQALAVCRSLLELEPHDVATLALAAEIDAARTGAPGEEPTHHDDHSGKRLLAAADDFAEDTGLATPPGGTRPAPAEDDTAPTPLATGAGLAPFASLPAPARAELAERSVARRFHPGDVIVRQGEPSESCFVIASGQVRVVHRQPDGTTGEVGRLGPGELFGDFALLADRHRHATVQAVDPTDLSELPRRALRELAATYPGVGLELERLYRERLVATLVGHGPFFRPVPRDQRAALMARFAPVRLEAGAPIVREGEPGGGLYLVVLGSVEITRRATNGRAVLLATLGEGAWFAAMAPVADGVAGATVTAAGPIELLHLSARDVQDLMALYPALWAELRRDARQRELADENILCGDTNLV